MNTTLVNLSIKAGLPLSAITSKFMIANEELVDFANLIKHDEIRVNEFIKTFVHRKKLAPKVRWDILVTLNKQEYMINFITLDDMGKPEYEDEPFVAYVIKRYITIMGIPTTFTVIAHDLFTIDKKFNTQTSTMYILKHFAKEYYSEFLYSEFASNNHTPESLLRAISIVEEDSE